ncbi:hypothetical protein G6F37_010572 [Rhizopus arrhizus]|nr:hypothetical protein G6F38_010002 [Rhizopus arrhizus]KAG1153201.1 hypothetical protein G6F37_010572 [Rhizopus arrhizus]
MTNLDQPPHDDCIFKLLGLPSKLNCMAGGNYSGGLMSSDCALARPCPTDNHIYRTNKTVNIYSLLPIVISCQTAVIRSALESAAVLFLSIPKSQDRRVAPFLKPQELKTGVGQRFELAVQFLDVASQITYQPKWRIFGAVALSSWKFEQDRICLKKVTGRGGLQSFILLVTICQA